MEHKDEVEMSSIEREAVEGVCEEDGDETFEEVLPIDGELTSAQKKWLERLNGNLSPCDTAVEDVPALRYSEFAEYFRADGPQRLRTDVRLKVLMAIGDCRTLKMLYSANLADCRLSVKEWEALLVPMPANGQLKEIHLCSLESAEEEALIGPLWQNLVRHAKNLTFLSLDSSSGYPVRAKLAVEIISGLRENSLHALKWLNIDMGQQRDANSVGVRHVAEMISFAPQLDCLWLSNVCEMDGGEKEALTTALRHCHHLKTISLANRGVQREMGRGVGDVLVDVYSGSHSNSVLENLYLWYHVGVTGEQFALLTQSNIRNIRLSGPKREDRTFWSDLSVGQWQNVGRSLRHVSILESFRMTIARDTVANFEIVAELWKASEKSPVLSIDCNVYDKRTSDVLRKALSDTYLKRVGVWGDYGSEEFFHSLASNTSVQDLTLGVKGERKELQKYFFNQLRHNSSIKKLSLVREGKLGDENFRDLMDLLEVNFILEEINVSSTSWGRDEKSALIDEALRRNKRRAGYFSVLAGAGLPFAGAKAGRVFLCGMPFAGKTQMKLTMMDTLAKKSQSKSLKQHFGKFKLQRTKGIEVEVLCDDEFVTISIWDLAGQEYFRALQNILFPRINQACLFVFIFNPFEGDSKSKRLKAKLCHTFDQELKSWLRFIVSNSQVTGHILPQVLVIITHKDKLQTTFDFTLRELEGIVKRLQSKFKDVVDLCPCNSSDSDKFIHHVNAKDKIEVLPVTNLVISCMKDVLNHKSPRVPTACSELVSLLLKRAKEIHDAPLWSCEKFYNFCSMNNSLLARFNPIDEIERNVFHAIASYMHDVGAICMIGNTQDLVVDLNWLTQVFLGELIKHGHEIQVQEAASTSHQQNDFELRREGFIDSQQLSNLIGNILQRRHQIQQTVVNINTAIAMLLELDLCFYFKNSSGIGTYFMPIVFAEEHMGTKKILDKTLRWNVDHSKEFDHLGFRVQCYDRERTSFSPSFYPRYQIHLRKHVATGLLQVIDQNFIFCRSHVEIQTHGCYIIVEIDETTENHIDIMVMFPKQKTRDWITTFVQKHIVNDIIEFCASERGCPGMQLVVGILRTECVRQLTPRELRTNQAVLIEELKSRLQNDVEDRLQSGKMEEESLFDYMYSWPGRISSIAPHLNLFPDSEPAKVLLPSKDFIDVCTEFQKKHEDLRLNLNELCQISNRLEDISSKFSNAYHNPDDLSLGEKLILQAVQGMNREMTMSFEHVRNDLKSTFENLHSQMSQVTCKIDTIIGYKMSKEKHRTPRRPYFSCNLNLKQKIKAKISSIDIVYLHLMCEARHASGPHFIKDQPGLELRLEKDGQFSLWMRRLSIISLTMIWILMKIGVEVTTGLGSVVPDISNLTTGISIGILVAGNVVLDEMEIQMDANAPVLKDTRSIEETWYCLRDYLDPYLTRKQCASLFKLHQVKYRNSVDPFAWLCKSCISSGKRSFLLDCECLQKDFNFS